MSHLNITEYFIFVKYFKFLFEMNDDFIVLKKLFFTNLKTIDNKPDVRFFAFEFKFFVHYFFRFNVTNVAFSLTIR